MIKTIALILLLVGPAFARPAWHELDSSYSYSDYIKDFEKEHDVERKDIFENRLKMILEHNSSPHHTWKMGVNHMSDWTDAERKALNGYKRMPLDKNYASRKLSTFSSDDNDDAPPASMDWREKNVVTAVKNQGGCGSCWSFATAEVVESHLAISKGAGKLETLSEQQILSCPFGTNPEHCGGTGGCSGGTAEVGFMSIVKAGGLTSEWFYPYTSFFGNNSVCSPALGNMKKIVELSGHTKLTENDYASLLQALGTVGPVAVSVDASKWSDYESGVFDGCNQTNPEIDHAVVAVGYGNDDKLGPYWIIRNSWSPSWGEDGYIRLRRHTTNTPCGVDINPSVGSGCDNGPPTQKVCGTCGVLSDSSFPNVV